MKIQLYYIVMATVILSLPINDMIALPYMILNTRARLLSGIRYICPPMSMSSEGMTIRSSTAFNVVLGFYTGSLFPKVISIPTTFVGIVTCIHGHRG